MFIGILGGCAAPLPSVSDFSGSSMKKASPASLSRLGSSLCYHQSDTTPSSGADLFTSTCDTSDNNTTMNGKYSLHANRIGCDQTQQIAKSLSDVNILSFLVIKNIYTQKSCSSIYLFNSFLITSKIIRLYKSLFRLTQKFRFGHVWINDVFRMTYFERIY